MTQKTSTKFLCPASLQCTQQKKKLLPIVGINKDEIGKLESSIVHRRELNFLVEFQKNYTIRRT